MNLNPKEVRAYILGLETAVLTAKRYKGISMLNYIGELEEMIDQAENIHGYREWLKKQGDTE
jgi:hypothetical protein